MSPKSIQEKVWHFHFKWTAVFEQRNPQINPENPLSRSINLTHVYALRDSKIWAGLKGPRLGTVKSKSNPYSMALIQVTFFVKVAAARVHLVITLFCYFPTDRDGITLYHMGYQFALKRYTINIIRIDREMTELQCLFLILSLTKE